jgi:Phosphotransferase enzyme family
MATKKQTPAARRTVTRAQQAARKKRTRPPSPVLDAVAAATPARPVSWRHVVAGHTQAEKWVVTLDDGRTVFVKSGSEASARAQIDRERTILETIGESFMPRTYGGTTLDGWSTVVLEDLSNAHWPPPYSDDGAALLEAVRRVGETPAPAGVSRRPAARPLGTYWERIGAAPEPVLAHGSFSAAWLERCLAELDAAETRARLDGDDFLHDDVWHGNVCYADRGAVLIDWASASIGDRRLDLAYALLSIRASGAAPPRVQFEDEAAYAALLAGSNAYNAAQPVDVSIRRVSTLREGWLHDLRFALIWVAELLGLPRPDELG